MFSGTHYGINVDMGWLKDDVDGLKQVVDFILSLRQMRSTRLSFTSIP